METRSGRENPKHRAVLTLLVAAAASAAVWAVSPLVTGHAEPWDAHGLFYEAALAAAGLAAGTARPKPLWAHYLGSVAGQLCYELVFLKIGPLFVIGAAFLLGYSLLFLGGAFIGAQLRVRLGGPEVSQ